MSESGTQALEVSASGAVLRKIPWSIYALSLAAGLLSACLTRWMLGGIPHISDEISYAFQGRILAAGHLWLPPPAVKEGFSFGHILITADRWCSIYSPGWPMILALGWLLHIPWIINPLLLSLTIVGVWRLANLIFDAATANLSALLISVSPFVLLMSSGWMSHTSAMFFIVWSAFFSIRAQQTGKSSDAIFASAFAGAAFLVRPLTAVAMIWPLCVWVFVKSDRQKVRLALLFICGLAPFLAVYLIYNTVLFHHPILGGYILDPELMLTNGPRMNFAHRLFWYIREWNRAAWGWPWPDLLILLPVLIFWRNWSSHWWLIACPASLVLSYCFYDYADIVYSGPRYIYEASALVAILAARSVVLINQGISRFGRALTRILRLLVPALLLLLPLLLRLPGQVKYHSQIYHGQSRQFINFVEKQNIGNDALVLLTGDRYTIGTFYFVNALRPEKGSQLYVRDVPLRRSEILETYPREKRWELFIQLKPLPGPNYYHDRWELEEIKLKPCCNPIR